MTMLLKSLQIGRGQYMYGSDPKQKLTGKVVFINDREDEISLRITEESACKILTVVAEGLVEASKQVACDLTAEVLQQQAGLPALTQDPLPDPFAHPSQDEIPF